MAAGGGAVWGAGGPLDRGAAAVPGAGGLRGGGLCGAAGNRAGCCAGTAAVGLVQDHHAAARRQNAGRSEACHATPGQAQGGVVSDGCMHALQISTLVLLLCNCRWFAAEVRDGTVQELEVCGPPFSLKHYVAVIVGSLRHCICHEVCSSFMRSRSKSLLSGMKG